MPAESPQRKEQEPELKKRKCDDSESPKRKDGDGDALKVGEEEIIQNEEKCATIQRKEILEESEDVKSGGDGEDKDDNEEEEEKEAENDIKVGQADTDLSTLQRTIFLTLQSSIEVEECLKEILNLNMKDGQESELCYMIRDCCAQQRDDEEFYALLAQRVCNLKTGQKYVEQFENIFKDTYESVNRMDNNKLMNVAKFFAHLLYTETISWKVLEHIKMTEDKSTTSSRVFTKILMQDLSECMGIEKLNERLQDPTLVQHFEGLFPRDSPKNIRFCVNFFTAIGLRELTDEIRELL